MSDRNDLTRWNRAGLNRFDYVDGNAVEFLEILRQQLVRKFADPATGLCNWLNPPQEIPANEMEQDAETLVQRQQRLSLRNQRLLETYLQDRRDWTWEISRSFARCCHMLTEHANAYANEGFLGTATQWEHVRRLVEMLDYHPAPPASASTWLSFIVKEGKSGLVGKGFQVKNSPPAGGDKVIFETLGDLVIDHALNELRPKGWDESGEPAVPDDGGGTTDVQTLFSPVAEASAIRIQGIGKTWVAQLNKLTHPEEFKIRDFLGIDPENSPQLNISVVRLREFKAKATVISYFELESGWSDISEWFLPDIANALPESLAELTGQSLEKVIALKLRIELIGAYLDHPFYEDMRLRDLLAPAGVTKVPDSVSTYWLAPKKPRVDPGQVAMIVNHKQERAEAASVSKVDASSAVIDLLPSPVQYSWNSWPLGDISLRVSARWQKECWLNGANVIRTTEPHGLSEGAIITWKRNGVWQFTNVIEADKRGLRVDFDGSLPLAGTALHEGFPLQSDVIATTLEAIGLAGGGQPQVENFSFPDPQEAIFKMKSPVPNPPGTPPMPPGSLSFGSFLFPTPLLPMDLVKAAVELMLSIGVMVIPSTGEVVFKSMMSLPSVDDLFTLLDTKVDWRPDLVNDAAKKVALAGMLQATVNEPIVLFQQILDNIEEKGPLIAVKKDPPVKAVVDLSYPLYMFDSSPDKIQSGDWVVGSFTDGLRALEVRAVNEYADANKNKSFSLSFRGLVGNEGELEKVYADFRGDLVPENARLNTAPVDPKGIELEAVPEPLKVGRDVLLAAADKEPVAAKIVGIAGNVITTNPPASGFTKGELKIYANVVLAGHGEIKPEKIIGSGNAAKSNQAFTLEVEGVSFTPDATKSAGVAAATEVEVAGRVWEQVSSLKDSAADDHHYEIRMTEEGYVKIIFGDGHNGRRLPTGKNNLRVRYRVGTGIAGNVPADSLQKPVKPNPLVDSVIQPLRAGGGGDMEDQDSLKNNAPPTLLAFKRTVSLNDFSYLAAARSNIWQAKAYREILQGGRMEQVTVIVVPAGGVFTEDIKTELQRYLQKQSMPGVRVSVESYNLQTINLKVTIRVDSDAFIPEVVAATVEAELLRHFSLQNRRLGEAFYLSEVYKAVEGIEGVENSVCVLNGNARVVRTEDRSRVIHLDTAAGSSLIVTTEEYLP